MRTKDNEEKGIEEIDWLAWKDGHNRLGLD